MSLIGAALVRLPRPVRSALALVGLAVDPRRLPGSLRGQAEAALRRRGRAAFRRDDLPGALAHLTRAARVGSHPRTWLWLARTYSELGEPGPAAAAAERALALDPAFLEPRLMLAARAQESGDEAAAARQFAVLARNAAGDEEATRTAMDALLRHHRPAEARTLLEAAGAAGFLTGSEADLFSARLDLLQVWLDDPDGADEAAAALRRLTPDAPDTLLAFWLTVGAADRVAEEAPRVPDSALPPALLRQAAIDLRARGHLTLSLSLAWRASELLPADERMRDIVEASGEELELLAGGLPLTPRRPEPAYEPQPRDVFYLLHNSLPYSSAGYATRTHGLLAGLRDLGWDAQGVSRLGYPRDVSKIKLPGTPLPPRDVVNGVPYHRLDPDTTPPEKRRIQTYLDAYAARLETLVTQRRPAILHAASNYWNGHVANEVAARVGIRSVYEVRGLWEVTRGSRDPAWAGTERYAVAARLEADACRSADKALAITGALREEMIRRGVPADHIVLVPNGVDASRFEPREPDRELARSLGIEGRTVIGYVGSVLDYEGLDLLLGAAARLRTRRSDFAVLIVGDGAAYDACLRLRDELGVADVVTFTGRVPHDQVESYYSLMDITPFPRLPMPVCEMVSPLKPFEAMAMGKVPVVSSVAALAEIVEDGLTGRVFAKGDVEELTAVLEELLDDNAQVEKLGQAARDWVVRERDWRTLTKRIDEVYAEVLAD